MNVWISDFSIHQVVEVMTDFIKLYLSKYGNNTTLFTYMVSFFIDNTKLTKISH